MAFNASNLIQAWDSPPGSVSSGLFQGRDAPMVWGYDAGSDTISDIEATSTPYFPLGLAVRPGDLLQVIASDGKALYRIEAMPSPAYSGSAMQLKKIADVNSFSISNYFPLLVVSPPEP